MKLAPYQFIHVRDTNSNIMRIQFGPQNYVRQEGEYIMHDKPQDFIVLKPYTYAVIADPVIMKEGGKEPLTDKHGSMKLRFGEFEIRTDAAYREPFPLYPGETLKKIDNLTIIPRNSALKVRANREFVDSKENVKRIAGEEWMIFGPAIYIPRVEEDKVVIIDPIVVETNKALKLRAKLACTDYENKKRDAGEEWLVRSTGHYLLNINEMFVEVVAGTVLTEKKALHLTATRTFVDIYGKARKAGEEWLITKDDAPVHICDVYEKIVAVVDIIVLQKNQYCYVLNPLEGGVNQMGKKLLVKGPISFFLKPGEQLDKGIKQNYVLAEDEALLLKAVEDFKEGEVLKKAGVWWMVSGPINYVPEVQVEVLEVRKRIPLDKIEGIYVRNYDTGELRAVIGESYMLKANEELAKKDVPEVVAELLKVQGNIKKREAYTAVTFKVPFNSVVQIYDYKKKKARVSFGPDLVLLQPDEQFTVNYLSGGTPKVPGKIKSLYITLGPTFSTDKIEQIETSDHARLELKLSYNWRFKHDDPEKDGPNIFNVRDFIGDMCSSCASRVRATVASMPFDAFHKSSAKTIRKAILGFNPDTGKVNDDFLFPTNGLSVFNVDIQSAEPIDKKTKESLQKTVTQAIEITTKIQEQEARRVAEKIEMEENGKLERLILENKSTVEEAKKSYLQLKAESEGVQSKGQAIAEAKAKANAAEIAANADVKYAELEAKAKKIKEMAEIVNEREMSTVQLEHDKAMSEVKIALTKQSADIESGKFKSIMKAIGQDTLVSISQAGPEMQGKMLESLGLQGYMMMDATNPINLFTAANGMINNG